MNKTNDNAENKDICKNAPKSAIIKKVREIFYSLLEILSIQKVKIPIIIIVYTALIATVSVSIDRQIIATRIKNVLTQAAEKEKSETEKSKINIYDINIGGEYAVDEKYNICVKSFVYNGKITPSSEKYNTYYTNTTDGNIYLDVIMDCTNLTSEEISASSIAVATIEHNNNNYLTVSAVEINDYTSFEYAAEYKVKPNETVRIHFISDVPSSIETDDTVEYANIVIGSGTYKVKLN